MIPKEMFFQQLPGMVHKSMCEIVEEQIEPKRPWEWLQFDINGEDLNIVTDKTHAVFPNVYEQFVQENDGDLTIEEFSEWLAQLAVEEYLDSTHMDIFELIEDSKDEYNAFKKMLVRSLSEICPDGYCVGIIEYPEDLEKCASICITQKHPGCKGDFLEASFSLSLEECFPDFLTGEYSVAEIACSANERFAECIDCLQGSED